MNENAPFDIAAFFGSYDLELHEVKVGDDWVAVGEGQRHNLMGSTELVVLFTNGVEKIAVEHDNRVVEFVLREVVLRTGDPLTTVERTTA